MTPPRVLIISNNSFSSVYNNGKTLEALFSSFPKDNLAQLYFHEGSVPDFSFCERYWKISEIDLIKSITRGRQSIGYNIKSSLCEISGSNKSTYPKYLKIIKDKTGNTFRDLLWSFLKWRSPGLLEWINSFEPQVIFFVGSSAKFSSKVAMELSSFLGAPLAVYYTDDYLFSMPQDTLLGKLRYSKVERLYNSVVSKSSACFAIGEMMAGEYSIYFKKPFVPVMNSVPIIPYEGYNYRDKTILSYFGGLHLNRWCMLSRLSLLLPKDCVLDVYTAPENITEEVSKSFKNTGINYKGLLSGDELNMAMRNSDVLLHVESDDRRNRMFTRLAVSTKIPEYLITGRPVIGFGPSEVASMRILSDNKIGYVVSSCDDDRVIMNKLSEIMRDFSGRKEMGERGYQYAKREFDMKLNSEKLKEVLASLIP